MNKRKTLYVSNRRDWRSWLEKHFRTAGEIWLVYPKKSSGKPRLSYNDAVEEALSFGWIDSTVRTLDAERHIQRFSPRHPNSPYSQANKERLKWLLGKRMVYPTMNDAARKAVREKFVFPQDILAAIKADPLAWKNYRRFSPAYRRIRMAYIDAARKRPEEFQKRLSHFIRKTRANQRLGFGGIEKHY
jgi:uncharacterized protein YdeI (YjbR/CyaY-like superfamily)